VLPFTVTVKEWFRRGDRLRSGRTEADRDRRSVVGVALTSADTALSLPSEVTPAMPSTAVTTM